MLTGVISLLVAAAGAGAATAQTVSVSIDTNRTGPLVAPHFLGLSVEAADLPAVARNSTRGNLVALLRSLGPGVLRFGGFTSDTNTAFSSRGKGPVWATTTIIPDDFGRLRTLARRTGWRVLLTLPLGHYGPRAAAREAAAAARRLGPALAAFEIGNEPNAFWLIGLRPRSYSYEDYRSEVRAYRREIARAAPGVPIAGPDVVPQFGGPVWLSDYARDERPALLTPHYYGFNACTQRGLTVTDLLSPLTGLAEEDTMSGFASIARTHDLPMRIGETNNVACAGQAGVSDTFASALWALRYMVTIARSGIGGVNFHTLPDNCDGYSAICASHRASYRRGRLRAMPEWYALLMFRRLVGQHFVRTSVSDPPPELMVAALRRTRRQEVDLLAVNTAPDNDLQLAIRLDGRRPPRAGTVLPLTAPGPQSRSGVRLGGADVRRDGEWRPATRLRRVLARAGVVRVTVPGASAALVRLTR